VLLVEDDEDDYVIVRDMLEAVRGQRYALEWVTEYDSAIGILRENRHDVCLCDNFLGAKQGTALLADAQAAGCRVPIIILTGQGNRDLDLKAMYAGAADYLVKGEVSPPLFERAIRYAIERKRADEAREKLIRDLRSALSQIKTLSGLLPICAMCKKVRDDKGYWNQIEAYIHEHADVVISHGICPECTRRLYPEFFTSGEGQQQSS